jgi:uncharacterized protein (DUF433 family)
MLRLLVEVETMNRWNRITLDSAMMNGQPCVRGMRLTVRRVLEALTIYPDWSDLLKEYPELEPEDIRQCLDFAARNLDVETFDLDAA